MPNQCSITIKRGRNKGRLCREVNKTCRHQSIQCPNCGEDFSYKHTYTTHAKSCALSVDHKSKPKLRPKPRTIHEHEHEHGHGHGQHVASEILARIHNLEQENKSLKDKVQQVADQPRNINNIMVIGNDFFEELTAKIGKDSAVEFLSSAATTGKPIDVIDKLYLEGKDPMSYPIACRNEDHFRYMSNDGQGGRKLVDDHGGSIIGDLMMNKLRNAFLMAANELISKHVDGSVETDKDVLRSVQNIATVDKNVIVYQLAEATNNSNHPFFVDHEDPL